MGLVYKELSIKLMEFLVFDVVLKMEFVFVEVFGEFWFDMNKF